MAQDPCSCRLQDYQVFDAHAAPVRQVDAWFDREDHAWLEHLVATGGTHPWALVHFKTDAVPEAMQERIAIAGAGDDVARQGVGFATGHAWAHTPLGFELRLEHDGVDLRQAGIVWRAEADRTCHVRAVAV